MTADKLVCNRCVMDEPLAEFILDEGDEGRCDYSGSEPDGDLKCVRLGRLVERIEEDICREYSNVDAEMLPYDREEGCYYCDTYATEDLLTRQIGLEAGEAVMADIVSALPDLTWCKKRFQSADLTDELRAGWEGFVDLVKHHTRYLFLGSD